MIKNLRKRQSSESRLTEDIKHIKTDQAVKENIPPELCETLNPVDNRIKISNSEITTPKKLRDKCKEQPVTPSTNFKLLASLAADLDYAECLTPKTMKQEIIKDHMTCESDLTDFSTGKVNRKEKSLGIICTRFLEMYPIYPPLDKKTIVQLDEACVKLGVERRRLYDIVNVFEGINILTKNAKNQYLWFGKNNLVKSLYKLKEDAIKENMPEKLEYVLKTDKIGCKQSCILNDVKNFNEMFERPDSPAFPIQSSPSDVRKEKSLGIMSQKFLMLFLISPNKVISLGVAAKVLNGFLQKGERGAQIKTQIRRLYDIANVLTSIRLIQKETSISECMRKPAFKYIGPDLKDYKGDFIDFHSSIPQSGFKNVKSRSLVRHSSFQEICEVAEIEHKKLNFSESCNSAPPFDSALSNDKENIKTNFENLQLYNKTIKSTVTNTNIVQSLPKVKIPVLLKPSVKVVNLKKPAPNPIIPYLIINNLPSEKSNVKYTNSIYGNQTFFLINTAPPKEVKAEVTENESISKVSSPQTIILSSEQRDAILQSLNISLSSEQTASIHLDGDFQSNGLNDVSNILTITNKPTSKLSESKNMKAPSQKDIELNSNSSASVNNTRSNTPSSIQTLDSPLSIPSGYVTPIPNVSSDISFVPTAEVNDILRKIEGRSSTDFPVHKVNTLNQEKVNLHSNLSRNPIIVTSEYDTAFQNNNTEEKRLVNTNSNNQVSQLLSNDSCSDDSLNLEVTNILKGKCFSQNTIKSKPFLIDEKTLLSPIKTPNIISQLSENSNLNTPPYITPETVFVFNTPPSNYQNSNKNYSNGIILVPSNIAQNKKKNSPTTANLKPANC